MNPSWPTKFLTHILLLLLCGCGFTASAQSADLKPIMDKILHEQSISSHDVETLDASDLRILRNTIFARHGYRFKSKDLQTHFAQYGWYKPTTSNVDSLLTPVDRDNLSTVQQQEHVLLLIAEVSPAPRGDTVTLNAREDELVGMWHQSFNVASGYSERYHFFPSRWVIWYANEMDCGKRLLSLRGRWRVEGSLLHIEWRTERVAVGGTLIPSDGSCASDSMLVDAEYLDQTLLKPRLQSFVLSPTEETDERENELLRISLDQEFYWKMNADPFEGIY